MITTQKRLAAALVIGFAATAVLANPAKLDAGLRRHLDSHAASQLRPKARSLETTPVAATVQFTGDGLAAMKARGVTIRSVIGNVATVLIPIDRLAEVAALPQVLRLETPSRPVPRLNKSVTFTHADQLRSGTLAAGWTGSTGKGVIVGVIDSGIDISHGDFLDAAGRTRILRLWNQRSVTGGTPPTGADGTPMYGAECDASAINAVINTPATAASTCNPDDNDNHGSHVAGIAAGNGRGTGNSQAAGRFVGMAPEADLLIANSLDKAVSVNGDPVLDAIAWMTRVAKQLNKPLVINLSLGSYFGSRDGTGSTQSAIDAASGAGVIIVAAAGNEGNAPIRTEIAPMTQSQTVDVGFSIPASSPARTAEQLEFWSNGDNQYSLQITCPSGAQTAFVLAGNSLPAFDSPGCGQVQITSTAPSSANGDRQYNVSLRNGTNPLASGNWTLSIRADTVAATQSLGIISGETAQGATFTGTLPSVTSGILTDTASARRAIAVAALNTNYTWNSLAGATDYSFGNGPLGDVGTFSSRGPRRVCSANAKYMDISTSTGVRNRNECTLPVMKPEITAPGSYIMSTLAGAAKAAATTADVEADAMHVAYMGTSMATPHVTGAVALLLQTSPSLTPEDAKRLLFTSLQSNQYTQGANLPLFAVGTDMPANPNDAWGYGAMDTAKAVQLAMANGGASATTVDVRNYIPSALNGVGYMGFIRVINTGSSATAVTVAVLDESGGAAGTARTLVGALPAGAAVTYAATNVEQALGGAINAGARPRIRVSAPGPIQVQSFQANPGGISTLNSSALSGTTVDMPSYLPWALNTAGFVSYLRIINTGSGATAVNVALIDGDTGAVGPAGTLNTALPAGAAATYSGQQIEAAIGVSPPASARPRIRVTSTTAVEVQSFQANPGGVVTDNGYVQFKDTTTGDIRNYIPAALGSVGYMGFIRVINTSSTATPITVAVIDENTGAVGPAGTLVSALPAGAAVTYAATNIEQALGAPIAAGARPRIRVSAQVPIQAQSFQTNPGGITTLNSSALTGTSVDVPSHLPWALRSSGFVSYLRVINTGTSATAVSVALIDGDTGVVGAAGTLNAAVPAGAAITYSGQQVEAALGITLPASARPRLRVTSSTAVEVQSFQANPGGVVTDVAYFQ